jgi:hypothetical protein
MSPATTRRHVWIALLFAIAMNATNLAEPLAVDDVCHHYYAAQVARDPLHPYEFVTVWHQKPVPAWDVMVAPVHSYYWAPLLAWADGGPVAWKAWFLPLQWLFCWSLLVLLQRWCARAAVPLLVAIAIGPAVLPGVNMMLEVPMLAFAFASVVMLLRSFDRRSLALAAFAGLLLGLAFQTKYSAMGFAAPWALLAIVHRRWREAAVAVVAAVATVLAIEGLVALSHGGGSYFMRQLELRHTRNWPHLFRGLVLQTGWLGVPAAMLALLGLGAPRWTWCSVGGLWLAGHVVVAMSGGADERLASSEIDSVAYLLVSVCTWATAAWLLLRLARSVAGRVREGRCGGSTGLRVFLLAWMPAEILTSLVISPFPAARRALLVVVAFTIAAGWLAARRRGVAGGVRAICALAAVVGIGYQGIDVLEGRAVTEATAQALAHTRSVDPKANVWFAGGWGFEFEAMRAGMKPFLRDRSEVATGDFIVVGSIDGIEKPWWEYGCKVWGTHIDKNAHAIEPLDPVPLSTLFTYYSGRRPIEGQSGPRFVATVYRVRQGFHAHALTEDEVEHEHPAHELR